MPTSNGMIPVEDYDGIGSTLRVNLQDIGDLRAVVVIGKGARSRCGAACK